MKIFTWKQRILVMSVTLIMIFLFAFVGYLIGKALGNYQFGIALGALISYPFTQFTLVRSIQRLHKKEQEEV